MKRICALIILCCALSMSAPAEAAVVTDVQGKLGTAYAVGAERFGLDLSCQYFWEIDPFFALGGEAGFFWIKWNRTIGTRTVGASTVDVKADTNAYDLPFFVNAQLRLPNLRKVIYVMPYLTIGLGGSFMVMHYSEPDYSGTDYDGESITRFFGGFSWQVIAGAGFRPEGSKIEFMAEAGYRGSKLKSQEIELNMSGVIIRAGVKYPFGV
jgi:opacity protein-like surface antigen